MSAHSKRSVVVPRRESETPFYFVNVAWVNPRTGSLAPSDRLLHLEHSHTPETYLAFDCEHWERYLFASKGEAVVFKQSVTTAYRKKPQYFVIDDDGNVVQDSDGDPIVVWEPELIITPASAGAVKKLLPEWPGLSLFAA